MSEGFVAGPPPQFSEGIAERDPRIASAPDRWPGPSAAQSETGSFLDCVNHLDLTYELTTTILN